MRGVIAVCVLFFATVALADKEEFKKYVEDCVKELDVKKDDKGHPDKEDAAKKCLAKCVGEKSKMMDANGKLIEANIPEKLKTTLKECDEKVKETDACKRANEMMKCAKSKKGGKGKMNKDE